MWVLCVTTFRVGSFTLSSQEKFPLLSHGLSFIVTSQNSSVVNYESASRFNPLEVLKRGLVYGNMQGFTTVMKLDTHVHALGGIGISDRGVHATVQERPLVSEI